MAWAKVLAEIVQATQGGTNPVGLDTYRRGKIAGVAAITHRPLVIYGTACTTPGKAVPEMLLMIEPSDKIGFDEVTRRIPGTSLDVLVHSPGGLPDATAAIVDLLRQRFTDLRFIVPFYAKSAATMLVLSGNEVLMGHAAELGAIDPPILVVPPAGIRLLT